MGDFFNMSKQWLYLVVKDRGGRGGGGRDGAGGRDGWWWQGWW